MLEEEAGEVAEDPFMGWEGWPPKSVVIVTIVLGIIFEIVFCIGFWQFWCLPPPPRHYSTTHARFACVAHLRTSPPHGARYLSAQDERRQRRRSDSLSRLVFGQQWRRGRRQHHCGGYREHDAECYE